MNRNIIFRVCALLLLGTTCGLLSACDRPPQTDAAVRTTEASAPLLEVNDRALTRAEFETAFSRTLPSGQTLTPEERADLERVFLVQMIDRKLMLGEAEKRGISVTEAELDRSLAEHRADYPAGEFEKALQSRNLTLTEWRTELREKLLMEKVLRQVVYERVEPSDEEVRTYYEENREEFDRPAQVRARQIVVAEKEEAQRILGLLRQGESFAAVAAKYSLSPDAEQGGDLGYFAAGEMPPEFDQAVFKLQPGRLSDLVKTEYGFHIFLVEEKRPAQQLSFAEVRADIHRRLKARQEETAYHQWLQELRSAARIAIDWAQL